MPYHWAISPLLTDSIASLQTCAALEQYLLCGVKCSFATVLLIFINLSKMTQGDTRVGTRDLSNCCRMLCDCATFPHVKTFKTPQTRAVDSVLKEWFVFPNGMFVRFWSHLCHLIQIYHKGISEFEPGIPRTASQWSTTELCHGLLGHPSFERCHLSEALHLRYGSSKFFFFFKVRFSFACGPVGFANSFKNSPAGEYWDQIRDLLNLIYLFHQAISLFCLGII